MIKATPHDVRGIKPPFLCVCAFTPCTTVYGRCMLSSPKESISPWYHHSYYLPKYFEMWIAARDPFPIPGLVSPLPFFWKGKAIFIIRILHIYGIKSTGSSSDFIWQARLAVSLLSSFIIITAYFWKTFMNKKYNSWIINEQTLQHNLKNLIQY